MIATAGNTMLDCEIVWIMMRFVCLYVPVGTFGEGKRRRVASHSREWRGMSELDMLEQPWRTTHLFHPHLYSPYGAGH